MPRIRVDAPGQELLGVGLRERLRLGLQDLQDRRREALSARVPEVRETARCGRGSERREGLRRHGEKRGVVHGCEGLGARIGVGGGDRGGDTRRGLRGERIPGSGRFVFQPAIEKADRRDAAHGELRERRRHDRDEVLCHHRIGRARVLTQGA